jgi:hypothetical protein
VSPDEKNFKPLSREYPEDVEEFGLLRVSWKLEEELPGKGGSADIDWSRGDRDSS